MADKIKPLKFETSVDGTEVDFLPTEANPTEDYVAAKGVAFENSDNTTVEGASGIIKFKDSVQTTQVSLTDLKTASQNTFENSTNGFTATNVQTAIEEAKATAVGLPRYTLQMIYNGTAVNNDWLAYDNTTAGSFIVVPINSVLKEIAWSNTNASVSFQLGLYKNGRPGTLLQTFTVTNLKYGTFTGLSHSYAAGDRIDIKYIDTGTNASDLCIILFLQVAG